ncbi:MAG: hypothetical protein R3301_11035 [Saprospiraceae bacterium]|nr:hypothetical protein [Saprospiraceae bacterium]
MKADSTIQSSTAYQAFFAIDEGEFKEKIKFINRHRASIATLTLDEYVEIMDAYAEALFETGRFHKHLVIADELIELSIMHNIRQVAGKDLYFETLFQKAASLYNLNRIPTAIHILQELMRMHPDHESTRLFLINCYVRQQHRVHSLIRRVSIAGILAAATFIALELLVVRPFIPEATGVLETTRNALFIGGVGTLLAGELWVRYRAVARMYKHLHPPYDRK